MEAQKRNIKSGKQFDKYFTKSTGINHDLEDRDVLGTLEYIAQFVRQDRHKIKALSHEVLKGRNIQETAHKIWSFLYTYIQYELDEDKAEQLRCPLRSWSDRSSGIDCDCYSLFISCVLTNLNIKHGLRITEYSDAGWFQHVYVFIPLDNGKEIIIDPVMNAFNTEKIYTTKHDKIMEMTKIPHQYLAGTSSMGVVGFGDEFNSISLSGLGSIGSTMELEEKLLEGFKQHLTNTFNALAVNPEDYESYVDTQGLRAQIGYVLEVWNDEVARDAALQEMSEMEDNGETAPLVGAGLDGILSDRFRSAAREKVTALRNRRKISPRVLPATISRGTIQANPTLRQIQTRIQPKINRTRSLIQKPNSTFAKKHIIRPVAQPLRAKPSQLTCLCNPTLSGLAGVGMGGFWNRVRGGINKVKNKVKEVGSKIKNAGAKVKDKIKEVGSKVKDKVKEVGSKIVASNPVSFAIRKGIESAARNNLKGLSSRLYLAFGKTSLGYDSVELGKIQKIYRSIETVFEKVGGSKGELRAAIMQGARKGALSGLGSIVAAATAIIGKVIALFGKINIKKLLGRVKNIPSGIKNFFAERKLRKEAGQKGGDIDPTSPDDVEDNPFNPEDEIDDSDMGGDFDPSDMDVDIDQDFGEEDETTTNDGSDGTLPVPEKKKENDDKKPMTTGTKVAIGLGVAGLLGFGIYMATRPKKPAKPAKSLAGVPVNVNL